MDRKYNPANWRVAIGTYSKRYPYWVTRHRDGRDEYAPNGFGDVRKFASRETAQKLADKLQVTADFDAAREHMRLAVHHMIRATDGLQPTNAIMPVLERMAELYLDLTGRTL
jgi:hypothetical protein